MQKITKIEAQKRLGRFNVYLDGNYAFPVSEDVLIKYKIFKGMEVSEELKTALIHADNLSKLYQKALNYLSYQLRTVYEVKVKLAEISEDEEQIDQVIQKLRAQNLLNDQIYAESYVRTVLMERQKGPKFIDNQLKSKRVDNNIIQQAIYDFYPEESIIEIGTEIAEKQILHYRRDSQQMAFNKLRQFLSRRGFDTNAISIIMETIAAKNIENHDDQIIDKQVSKYLKKYQALDPYQKIQKTKQALYRKGFSMDDINLSIDKLNPK
ncbi:RecX family transcriptional regulator [Lentilactobacillus laojiaonis]|uniref:RecX family transcriptional regulator n=1 Tax=Lentilactobacillus laojiaonis TaxID=2883998 RepID=UPI001D09A36E|nr:RecX family transcriptional regulator [Lentilactobacillus laojiaonis]UDM32438.1 RecX family transcriptional regulator [Lentilactobacillus laojiaonis]